MLKDGYELAYFTKSDINEHLPVLNYYALKCNHITECGVREVVSSYAFAMGLKNKHPNKLVLVDLVGNHRINNFMVECRNEGVNVIFHEQSDLTCPLENTDMLFLDTLHVYGQLKRELARWHGYVRRYIIMHDTTIDEWQSEVVRSKEFSLKSLRNELNMSAEDLTRGLWPAIEEFTSIHSWQVIGRFSNNNGLTVLGRKHPIILYL